MEVWKDIEGYEDSHQVSSLGNVRTKDRAVKYVDGRLFPYKGKTLSPQVSGTTPYPAIMFSENQKRTRVHVHQLVCVAFNGKAPSPLHEVNHIDSNPLNNRADNLEWVTHSENIRHSYEREGSIRGEPKFCWNTPRGRCTSLKEAAIINECSVATAHYRCHNPRLVDWFKEELG